MFPPSGSMTVRPLLVLLATLVLTAVAHPHHDKVSDEDAQAPIDSILWIHVALQALVWGIIFPIGMVLGLTRSRWHVPLQSVGFLLTFGGYILGHSHRGRAFPPTAHGKFASIMVIPIIAQLCVGIYLKLHIHERTIRPYFVTVHGIIGKMYPVIGWVQMLFGYFAMRGYCRGGTLGQCLAHFIMGSGFIAYAVILAMFLLVGEQWVRRSKRSPDSWDSWVIMTWGIVNTFTEHRGSKWSVKDMQHTSLGVVWWAGGLLGVYLSRNNQRTVLPSVILILTGWAMSSHVQALMISTEVHSMFGRTLILAGVARILEVIYFAPTISQPLDTDDDHSDHTLADGASALATNASTTGAKASAAKVFRHSTPILLVCSGILFMSGTDEELSFAHGIGMDHVTYSLICFSIAFLIYTFVVFLINLWATSGRNAQEKASEGGIELSDVGSRSKWYSRVPSRRDSGGAPHILGDDDEDEDEMAPR